MRLNATVHDAAGVVLAAHTLTALAWDVPFWGPQLAEVLLPKAAAEVRRRVVWLLSTRHLTTADLLSNCVLRCLPRCHVGTLLYFLLL